jgi:hypothetical protein
MAKKDIKLTESQIEEIINKYVDGMPIKEIANNYNVSLGSVYYHTKRANLPRRAAGNTIKGSVCTCLKCGRGFKPYKYEYATYRHICPVCRAILAEIDIQTENPIGRMV